MENTTKNRYLYPTGESKLETGTADKNKNYPREIDQDSHPEFKIRKARKKKK